MSHPKTWRAYTDRSTGTSFGSELKRELFQSCWGPFTYRKKF